jgi:hypothetical protein
MPPVFSHRKKVVISLEDKNGESLLSRTLNLEDGLYRSVALTYAPAADNDVRLIESYGSLENAPPYLLRLLPELRIDGLNCSLLCGEPAKEAPVNQYA